MDSKLQAKVCKGFKVQSGFLSVVEDFELSVSEGEFIALVGPSGCGKSTLLDILSGFEKPDRGVVTVDGNPIDGPNRNRILMPQTSSIFPWLSAWSNLMFVQYGTPMPKKKRSVLHYLNLAGLADFRKMAGARCSRIIISCVIAIRLSGSIVRRDHR